MKLEVSRKVGRSDKVFSVSIDSVVYLEMPVGWKGADFQIGSNKECIQLLNNHRGWHDVPDTLGELKKPFGYRLIRIPHPLGVVRIVASGLHVVEEEMV
jgi:hypothetical protein